MVDLELSPPEPAREPSPAPQPAARPDADVVIVGAGLAGAIAALLLVRGGHRVVMVERHHVCPPQFRLEHIAEPQSHTLRRLGLIEPIAAEAVFIDHIVNGRNGRIIDHTWGWDYGLRYEHMVEILRRQLELAGVECLYDRVTDIANGPHKQQLTLAAQGTLTARLVVLATGMGPMLHERLGMRRVTTFERHSVDFGFDLAPAPGRETFPFPCLTYYGSTTADGIDYINIFPVPGAMRANVFSFRNADDPWVRGMMRAPQETLLATLPGLASFLGDFQATSAVRSWVMNLAETEDHLQPGVVLIGDAFQTSCPAAGTGFTRLLTDAERLATVHAPNWLAAGDASRERIAEFYADPVKQASDASSLALAHHRRRLTLDRSLQWSARRRLYFLRRGLSGWMAAGRERDKESEARV